MVEFGYSGMGREHIMRKIKAFSILLAVFMLANLFTGCASGKTTKITTEKFAKVCEKLGLDEFDLDGNHSPDIDDLEDGVYFAADEDMVEDNEFTLELFLKIYGFDSVIEAENIQSFAIAAKCTGLADLEDIEDPEDLEDVSVDGALAFQMTLDDDYSEDLMEFLADGFDEMDIKTKKLSDKEIENFRIKCYGGKQWVNTLSGGNKQKVSFSKWTAKNSDVLIMDCPTRGVDIGVKQFMYHVIDEMKKQGKSIILISEELVGNLDNALCTEFLALQVVSNGHSRSDSFQMEQIDDGKQLFGRDMVYYGSVLYGGYHQLLLIHNCQLSIFNYQLSTFNSQLIIVLSFFTSSKVIPNASQRSA